jgi:hypothetical protein
LSRYFEIFFRSKLRLVALLLILPLALSALNLYLWRSYVATEVVWVDDLGTFGQGAALAVGYNTYLTPAQNAALRFANVMGNQSFNSALGDKLVADGVINPGQERTALIASLGSLTVSPGGVTTAGSSATTGAGFSPDHIVTVSYLCKAKAVCLAVLAEALDVYRSLYSDLKARGVAAARSIYEAQLTTAKAQRASALAALQAYDASQAKKGTQNGSSLSDPVRTQLTHDYDAIQKTVDQVTLEVQSVDTAAQLTTGVSSDMYVIDSPKIQPGQFGIPGFRSDNLKTDAIILVGCLAAAVAYLVLVAFLDRTVRDPGEIKARMGKAVFAIPDFREPRALLRKAKQST